MGWEVREKSFPTTLICEMCTSCVEGFESVTELVCVAPTETLAKSTAVGLAVRVPPVPL